jgi:hypothetical protein
MAFPTIKALKPQGEKIIRYMKSKNYKIRALNIVYLEGIDSDLTTLNKDRLNEWNDVRCIVSDKGDVLISHIATTEPGAYYTYNRMNPKGAFRIKFGQYLNAWKFGDHFGQRALVQCGNITGFRDDNEDGFRTGDKLDSGNYFGVNQHTTSKNKSMNTYNAPVDRQSAGCLVGKIPSSHFKKFIPICESMGVSTFDTTIIDGSDFFKFAG